MSFNLKTLDSLTSAHASPPSYDHAPMPFHCSGALVRSTPQRVSPRTFTTLSGLAQHIERGACGEGSATLKIAMEFAQELLERLGLGSIRLLR